jgi:hypothetical protein
MSVITFYNEDRNEAGQSMGAAAIASVFGIERNYKILLISVEREDYKMEDAFFRPAKINLNSLFMGQNTAATDATNGIEGLMRMFSSNRVDADAIASYVRPVLKDRLDVLLPLKSRSKEEFQNAAKFYSPIIDAANKYYDLVLVDMCKDVLPETRDTIMNLSSLVVVGLNQNSNSIKEYIKLKEKDEKFRKNNVITALMKYDDASMFNAKNMARELKEKDLPLLVPYNIHFNDECSSGRILDFLLKSHSLHFTDRPDGYFYNTVKDTVDRIDTLRQQVDYGLRT